MQEDRSKVEDATIIDVEPQLIDEPVQKKSHKLSRRLGLALLIAALSAGGGAWFYRDVLANYFPSDETAKLLTRIDALEAMHKEDETRISAVIALTEELKSKLVAAQASAEQNNKIAGDAMQSVQAMTIDVTGIKDGFTKLQAQLKAVSTSTAQASADPALIERLTQLEQKIQQTPTRSVAQNSPVNAIVALKSMRQREANISQEWDLLRTLPADFPGLATVLAAKDADVKSASELAANLAKFTSSAVVATAPEEQGWVDYFGAFLSGLVTIENSAAAPHELALAKAKAFMASGDLGQAVASLEGAELVLPQDVQNWRAQANARLNLDKAMADLNAAVDAHK